MDSKNQFYNLCIIGAGAAGIITALEFSAKNPTKTVLLVEYGLENQPLTNNLDDSIQITNSLNHHLPYECTNKGLGGSTATWGGRCVMYDEIDFIERSILNGGCTWDLNLFDEIKNYTQQAAFYFECGEPIFNLNQLPEYQQKRIAEGFQEGDVLDSVIERWSMPTRFGKRYREEIEQSGNMRLLEGYEATILETASDTSAKIKSILLKKQFSTEEIKVQAEVFVIAAGAQETTRLLLKNQHIFPVKPNALGKYYQGHISGKIASVKFWGKAKATDYEFLKDGEVFIRRRFQFSTEYLRQHNLLNTAIWLDNPLYFDPVHRNGAMSFMYLAMITPFLGKKLAPPAIAYSVTKGKIYKVGSHILNVLREFPNSIITPFRIFYQRYLITRKLPGVFLFNPLNTYALHFHGEQIPDARNRMELSDDGQQLVIHYDLSEADINSVIVLHQKLDEWLRATQCGELIYWYPPEKLPAVIRNISKDGIHQSGTTRIGNTVEDGVVDTNLRVFGLDNLYLCSSSVFPTSGQANPTFLLGAFAVRLAHHLAAYEKN